MEPDQPETTLTRPHMRNEETREPEIMRAMAGLRDAVDRIAEGLDRLGPSLHSVLAPPTPDDSVPGDVMVANATELGGQIAEQEERCRNLARILQGILNRVEV